MVPLVLALSFTLASEGVPPSARVERSEVVRHQPRAGTAAVLVTRRNGIAPEEAAQWAQQTHQRLSQDNSMPLSPVRALEVLATSVGVPDATICKAKTHCLMELGRKLQVQALVSLSLSVVRKDLSFHLEVISTADGQSLASTSFVAPVKSAIDLDAHLAEFSLKLRSLLEHSMSAEPAGHPLGLEVVELPVGEERSSSSAAAFEPTARLGSEVRKTDGPRSRMPAYVAAGGAALTALATSIFVGQAIATSMEMDRLGPPVAGGSGKTGWAHSEAERQLLAKEQATHWALGTAGALATMGLGATVVFLW